MKIAALWLLAPLTICLGCGGDGSSTSNTGVNLASNAILGRWAAATIQGPADAVHDCPASIMVSGATYACGLLDTQIFHNDGSYSEVTGAQRGTWSTSGSTLTVTIAGQKAVNYTYSIQSNRLTERVATASGPVTIVLNRQ